MSILYEARPSDSPYLDSVTWGRTLSDGRPIRPAEMRWHLVIARYRGKVHVTLTGPWSRSGVVTYDEGAEVLWIRFKLGTFMPHLPTRDFLNREIALPNGAGQSFWLNNSVWQFPTAENVETFANRLARETVLMSDPVVAAALQDHPLDLSPRTVRHHFLHTTGLTQAAIRQMVRAQQAADQIRQGKPILDTVYDMGYFDQPHLTRALRQYIGYTPSQIMPEKRAS
ncbi:MAG: helix-turn-helix domain-containing protein [Anaerolineae bacterium]